MKIALTCTQENMKSPLDTRFGRAPHFYLSDSEGTSGYFIPNTQNKQAVQGAGIQAAQTILREDAEVLITGHCGPKAFKVLTEGGVRIFKGNAQTSLEETLKDFSENKLEELSNSDVEGHWI